MIKTNKKKAKPKIKSKVRRKANGQIIKGSSGLPGAGRKIGSKSTGKKPVGTKKIKSAHKVKTTKRVKTKKSVNRSKKQVKNGSKPLDRDKHGKFLLGHGGNGGGRPRGSFSNVKSSELESAFSKVESKLKFNWLERQIIKSLEDTTLAVAFLNKRYPSLKAIEINQTQDYNSPERLKEIERMRAIMRKRMEPVPIELQNLREENARLRYESGKKTKTQEQFEELSK